MSTMTENEKKNLREIVRIAVRDGIYPTMVALGEKASIPKGSLYSFMGGRDISDEHAETLRGLLGSPGGNGKTSTRSNGKKTNGHKVANGNGHHSETNGNGASGRLGLTHDVFDKLAEIRQGSHNDSLNARIDEAVARWGSEGLELLTEAARRRD